MQVVSFYSYKGGVGRTTLLLNTAWYLALKGHRVAMLDLDLEAPGLTHADLRSKSSNAIDGFLELVKSYRVHQEEDNGKSADFNWDKHDFIHNGLGPNGCLALIPSGNIANRQYAQLLHEMNWPYFFGELDGAGFMEGLLNQIQERGYEYLFVDARTGLTDVANVSTVYIPDTVVLVSNLAQQSIDGIHARLKFLDEENKQCKEPGGSDIRIKNRREKPIATLLVGCPLPRGEWALRQKRVAHAKGLFGRPFDVEVDYLDQMAIGEEQQILFQQMENPELEPSPFLTSVTLPFRMLADQIARLNPRSSESRVEDGKLLWQMGLWRLAKAHHDEGRDLVKMFATKAASHQYEYKGLASYQEADLAWRQASLEALDPETDFKELEEVVDSNIPAANRQLRIQRAQLFLALSYRFILMNKFPLSAESAEKAVNEFNDLFNDLGDNFTSADKSFVRDMRALSYLRQGYAKMLQEEWDAALESTTEAINDYQELVARPVLRCLAYCQAARIGLNSGKEPLQDIEKKYFNKAKQCDVLGLKLNAQASGFPEASNDAENRAENRAENEHVLGELAYVEGRLEYEKGRGRTARAILIESYRSFDQTRDRVGTLEVLLEIIQLLPSAWQQGWPNGSVPFLGDSQNEGAIDEARELRLEKIEKVFERWKAEWGEEAKTESSSGNETALQQLTEKLYPQLPEDSNAAQSTLNSLSEQFKESGHVTRQAQVLFCLALGGDGQAESELSSLVIGTSNELDKWPWMDVVMKRPKGAFDDELKQLEQTIRRPWT